MQNNNEGPLKDHRMPENISRHNQTTGGENDHKQAHSD